MQIFISHISEEQPLAFVIKGWLDSAFLGKLDVFVSSDPDDIPAGTKWLNKISDSMNCSDLLIILYSPQSTLRPWINFEAGCGWIKNIPIIPICHSGLKVSQLESPISSFQGLDIESNDFTKNFFDAVTKLAKFKQAPRVSNEEFIREIKSAISDLKHKVEGTPTDKKNELSKEQMKIMRHLVEDKNSQGWGVNESYLASLCQVNIVVLNYHIHLLVEKKHVEQNKNINMGTEPTYSITQAGIHYMISNGLYK